MQRSISLTVGTHTATQGRSVFAQLLWLGALGSSGASLAWALLGDTALVARVVGFGLPWIFLVALLGLIISAIGRRLGISFVFTLSLFILFPGMSPNQFRVTAPAITGNAGLRIVTHSNRTLNEDMPALAAYLSRIDADIHVVQEVADQQRLLIELSDNETSSGNHVCAFGAHIVLSRFPIELIERTQSNVLVLCEVNGPWGKLRVGSVHLPRSVHGTTLQTQAADILLAEIRKTAIPTILAGDFNATPASGQMVRLEKFLDNAFDKVGAGPGFTFPTNARRLGTLGPFLRIDHVLHSQSLSAISARVLSDHPPQADHFPVEVVFRTPGTGHGQ